MTHRIEVESALDHYPPDECLLQEVGDHAYMLAITMVYYNFCRKHLSLKGKTPAMAAGLTEHRWTASDMLALDMWANVAAAA
jgi:hypothetical protein